MVRNPLRHRGSRTRVPLVIPQYAPQRCTIVISLNKLLAQIGQKRVERAPLYQPLALFRKLIGAHEAAHRLTADSQLLGNRSNALPFLVQCAHLCKPRMPTCATLGLPLFPSRPHHRWRLTGGRWANDRVGQQCRLVWWFRWCDRRDDGWRRLHFDYDGEMLLKHALHRVT